MVCMVQGLNPSKGKRVFFPPKRLDQLWGPPSLLFSGYEYSFPGVKWPVFKVYRSPRSNAEVKNELSYTSAPAVCLHGVDRDDFTFFISCSHC
jgi:hypothetical protein